MEKRRKLTVACIAADLIPGKLGGAELHAVEVTRRLADRHHILLFVGRNTSIQKYLPENAEVFSIYYPKIPNLYGLSYILFAPLQVIKVLSRRKIDLIWAKQVFPQAIVGAILSKLLRKPFYITAQNPRLLYEELVLKGALLKPFHKLFADILNPLIVWAISRAEIVAAVSQYSAESARKMKARKVVIIPNGVNVGQSKLQKKKNTEPFTMVSASSLIPRNGLDTLIEAVALLSKDLDWQLLIAGDGPEENNLKFQITKLKLEKKVILLGRLKNEDIPTFLADAHVFVRPSRREGFGIAFLDAMEAGIPVVGTNVGGIPDFITDRKTGLMVKANDPRQLANALSLLRRDPILRKKIITNAHALVLRKYQWNEISKSVEKEFQKICH